MIKLGIINDLKLLQNEVEKLPRVVVKEVQTIVRILDEAYGNTRNIEADLGGFVAIVQCKKDFLKLQQDYHVRLEDYEFIEPIQVDMNTQYAYALYQLSADYAVAVIADMTLVQAVITEKEQ